jgi:hypothetical protein
VALALVLLGSGCGKEVKPAVPPTATACAEPLRGQRFAVCGQLSTSVGAAQGTAWVIDGSADARAAQTSGSRFQVQEGTFHAGR